MTPPVPARPAPQGPRGAGADRSERVWAVIRAHTGGTEAVRPDSLCRAARAQLSGAHPGVAGVAVSVPAGSPRPGSGGPGSVGIAQTLAACGPLGRVVEELQVTVGEGPTVEAMTSPGPILVLDCDAADVQARWPLFAPAAAAAGLGSLYVTPMRIGAARFGLFAVYLDRPGGLGPEALAETHLFAAITLDLLLEHAGAVGRHSHRGTGQADPVTAELTDARLLDPRFYDDRPEIHQATGMVSVQLGVDLGTALLRLRGAAFTDGRLLSELAADVVSRKLRFTDP